MAVHGVNPKCYILALFVRDDEERFLLGDGPYEFKDKQLHFQPNTVANDVVEVQGNDGYLLAGQVRRPGVQAFDGYVGMGTTDKATVETQRRAFFQFFRRGHFYKVIYVFPNGTAIQRKQGFLVDDPTVQELYQQYPEYHVALNFEDVNYYTYEEDSEGHEIYAKEAIIKLTGGGAKGGLIWDSVGVVWEESQWGGEETVDATAIQIDNQLNTRLSIHDTQLKGDTYQQTYGGYQLLPTPYASGDTRTHRGITYVVNPDGTITMNGQNDGTASSAYYFVDRYGSMPLFELEAGTYYFIPNNADVRYEMYDGTKYYSFNSSNNYTVTFANSVSIRQIYTVVIRTNTTNYDNYKLYPMLTKLQNPTTADYEPYTGGIPAPNPDYPQAVQVVTGVQTVTVTGKNLINSAETHNSINSSGTILNGDQYLGVTDYVPCEPNTVYAASFQHGTSDLNLYVGFKDNNGNFIIRNGYGTLRTFTTPENATSMFFYMTKTGATPSIGGYAMLEYGSTVSPFEPYQGQSYTIDLGSIELCNIGNYQDKIFNNDPNEDWYDPDLEDNAWYVHKTLGKYVFNGSETIAYNASNHGFTINPTNLANYLTNLANPPLNGVCSHFKVNTTTSTWVSDNTVGLSSAGTFWCKATSFATSQDDCKTWLTSNTPAIYYGLATPTDTQITDATLVGQLEAFGGMRLYVGENNIQVLPESGTDNLPAIAHFKYYTTLSNTGAEWEEGGTSGATIVEVDAIDNTYPVWELVGPSVNPTLTMLTTNTTLVYNGTISSSQKLVIDMFNKTATLNGTSVIGNVSGDWTYMAPGTNRVAYTAGNTDAPDSTIYWQEVVG